MGWARFLAVTLVALAAGIAEVQAKGREQQSAPLAVAVLQDCDLAGVVRAEDLVQIVPLPVAQGDGCVVGWVRGLGDRAFVGGTAAIEPLRHPQFALIDQRVETIPGCYGAQQDVGVGLLKPGEEVARVRNTLRDGAGAAVDDLGLLIRGDAPSTPEALIRGTVVGWGARDAKGPVYYRVAGGGDYEVLAGDDLQDATPAGTTLASGAPVTVDTAAVGDTVIVEALDQCTTRTTVVRTSGTTTVAGGGPPDEEKEDIHLVPGSGLPPSAPPAEEDDEEQPPLYCTIHDGDIYTPVTREFFKQEDQRLAPAAKHDPAVGAIRAQLASGRMLETQTDLSVRSIGLDMVLERTYAGHMETEQGGNLGQRWQLNLDRRITVTAFSEETQGLKVEPLRGGSEISYANGYGRLDRYQSSSKEVHQVLNFGARAPFQAHITTYRSPPGAHHEIQRYIVVRPSGELGLEADPENHPFAGHPDVDTEHGEALFYVLRTPEHEQYVFNCRGQNIFAIDRFNHRTRLEYDGQIHPLTHNKMLTKVIDANERDYVFAAEPSSQCAPFLTHYDGGIKSNACAPIPLFSKVLDPWGRSVVYEYDATDSQLTRITRQLGVHRLESGYRYVSSGVHKHLLSEAYLPAQSATEPYLKNTYRGGKLATQQLGGHTYRIDYPEKTVTTVTRPTGLKLSYQLEEQPAGMVVASVARTASNITRTTAYRHNHAGQVTEITYPRGNRTRYSYFGPGDPVRIPEAPMQNLLDAKITYRNSLLEGRLQSVTQISHLPDDGIDQAAVQFRYEPLYNQVARRTDARGNSTSYQFRYDLPGAYGMPVRVNLPDQTGSDGKVAKDLFVALSYDVDGNKVLETDAANHRYAYGYDDNGELLSLQQPGGVSQSYRRDARSNVIEEVKPSGLQLRYSVDARDLPVELIADPGGYRLRTRYQYDRNFNMVQVDRQIKDLFTAPRGVQAEAVRAVVKTVDFDMLNRPVSETVAGDGVLRRVERQYDAVGNVVRIVMPSLEGQPLSVVQRYDGFEQLVEVTTGDSQREYAYDENGNVSFEFDAEGNGVSYAYDGLDRRIEMVDALDTRHRYTLDHNSNLVAQEAEGLTGAADGSVALLRKQTMRYNEHNKPIEMAESSLAGGYGDVVTRFDYDRLGHQVREHTAGSGTILTERDALGRAVKVTDPVGNSMRMRYSASGQVLELTETEIERVFDATARDYLPKSKQYRTTFKYNVFDQLLERKQGLLTTRLCYDSDHNVRCQQDSQQGLTESRFDIFGRLRYSRNRLGETRMTYTPSGLPRSIESPRGREQRAYDVQGRLVKVTDAQGKAVTTRYDRVGNPVQVIDANGRKTINQYGPSGLLTIAESGGDMERFRHDGLGRIVQADTGPSAFISVARVFDGIGELIAETQTLDGAAHTVHFKPDSLTSRTLVFPKALGGQQVVYQSDALGRVYDINLGARQPGARYHYSGKRRLAGRSVGDHATSFLYDDQRRLSELAIHRDMGESVRWRGIMRYDGLQHAESRTAYFPVSSSSGATRMERQQFSHDQAGRVVRTETLISSRAYTSVPWLHQSRIKYNRFDAKGKLAEVASSHAQIGSEGFFIKEDVNRASEVRVDRFSRDSAARITNTKSWVLDTNAAIETDAVGLSHAQVQDIVSNAGSHTGVSDLEQPVSYDAAGNLVEDEQFRYRYDFRNRLVEIDDKLAQQWHPRRQRLRIFYDPFGRPVLRQYRLSHVSAKAFDRKDTRFIYWGRQVIAELAQAPWQNGDWRLLARYTPGATAHEVLRIERRRNDDLTAPMDAFLVFEGMQGEVSFIAEAFGSLKKVQRKPHFTGEDGWVQGARDERFVEGTTTRMPYVGKGQRFDAFSRMRQQDGSAKFTYDYQAAPLLEYERYARQNYVEVLAKIDKHHPKPEFLRNLEYVAAGAMLTAMAPMLPLAAEGLLIMEMEGVIAAASDAGLSHALGHKVTADSLASSFAIGALSGGLSRVATGMGGMSRLSQAGQRATSFAVDVTVGTAMDVAVTGSDLSKALSTNLLSASISGGLSYGLQRAKGISPARPARTPGTATRSNAFADPRMPAGDGPMFNLSQHLGASSTDVINHVARLAADGMPAALAFVKDLRRGELLFLPPTSVHAQLPDRLQAYQMVSSTTRRTVIAFEDTMADWGLHTVQRNPAGELSQVLQIKRGQSSRFMAATLLHEFSHAKGANELQAFHITYDAMYRMRMHRGRWSSHAQVSLAQVHMESLNRAGTPAARLGVMRRLHRQINFSYGASHWQGQPQRAAIKTDPNGWISELGAQPWH
ncbi:MAG: DUF6531 domain-containing protein [Pseudomonadales bacterium]